MKQIQMHEDDPIRYDLLLQTSYAIELHTLYKKFFNRIDFYINLFQLIAGSFAFVSLFSKQIDVAIVGAIIALLAFFALLIQPGKKASESAACAEQFGHLYATSDSLSNLEFSKALDMLQFKPCSTRINWVRDVAYENNLLTNGREDATTPLPFMHKFLSLLFL